MKIALISDCLKYSAQLASILKQEGYEVNQIHYKKAMESASNAGPDLIIIGKMTCKNNYLPVIEKLKCEEDQNVLKNVPIVLYAESNITEDELKKLFSAGVSDYIADTADRVEIAARVRIYAQLREQYEKIRESQTEYRQSVDTLLDTQKKLTSILDTAGEGIFGLNLQGEHIFVNPVAAELLGYTPEDLIGRNSHLTWHYKHLDGSDFPITDCPIHTTLQSGIPYRGEDYFIRKDGSFFMAEYSSVPQRDETGITGCVVSFRDITERVKTEEELRIFKQAIEQSQVTTVLTDKEGTIEYVNPEFETTTGYTAAEAVGQNPRILKAGDMSDLEYKELWKTISSGKSWKGLFHNRRKDGELYWEQAMLSPVQDEKGVIRHYLGLKLDITKGKQLEQLLAKRLAYEHIVSRISSEALKAADARHFLDTCTEIIGPAMGVCRTYIIEYREESETLRNTAEWCSADTPSQKEDLRDVPAAILYPFIEALKAGEPLKFDDVEKMEESELKTLLRAREVLSLLNTPLFVEGQFYGLLGYDFCTHSRSWTDDTVAYLQIIGRIISEALTRMRKEVSLKKISHALGERLKERNTLNMIFSAYETSLRLEDFYQEAVDTIPQGFQYPEIACAELVLYRERYISKGFRNTSWKITHDVKESGQPIGTLTVCYLEEKQVEAARPFLTEEAELVTTIAVRLGHMIENKKMQEQLTLQALAMDSTDAYIIISDARIEDYPIVYMNSAFEKLTGYSPSEVMGRNPRFLHGSDTNQPGLEMVRKSLQEGESCRTLIRNYRADGTLFWNEINISPVLDESGKLTHFIGIANDVTELKNTQMELLENERRLRLSQEFANIGTWDWNIQTGALYWSKRIGPLFGYPKGDLETTYDNFLKAVHPDDRQAVIEAIERTAKTGDIYRIEHRCLWPDGTVRWLFESGNVEVDDDGKPLRMLGLVSDITERKTAEVLLREAEERLKLAIENAGDGVWDWDMKTDTMLFSRLYMEMLGYEENELPNHVDTWRNRVHPEDLDRAEGHLTAYLEGRVKNYEIEMRLRCKDGSYKWILCRGAVVSRDGKGKPERMIGIQSDISGRKQNEKDLLRSLEAADRANRAKSEFLSSMSHELRTPMNAILGFSQLLKMDKELTPLHLEWAMEILQAGNHLLSLINEILDLSRIESGSITLEQEPVDSSEIVKECLSMLSSLAERFKVSLQHESEESLTIHTDKKRLKQVLVNLLSNAVKYNKPQGRVTVRVFRREAMVRFMVQDTGTGIPQDRIEELFIPFNRLGREAGDIEGTGIGLSLSKQLIELMGGRIGAESVPQEGSTFWFELPVSQSPSENVEVMLKDRTYEKPG